MNQPITSSKPTKVNSDLQCCRWHPSAVVLVPDVHHLWPLGWGGPDVPGNKVQVCPNVHRLTHTLLNRYKRLGGPPPWSERQHFGVEVRRLAETGWEDLLKHRTSLADAGGLTDFGDLPDL